MDSTTNLINPDARMGLTGAQPGAAGSIAASTGGTGYAGGADFGGGFGPRMPMLNQFRNLSDRDGGAIVAALQQGNIPYKIAESGGAILVPSDAVHETRLRLASQGLPKNGSVGFELMDNQK